MASTIDILLEFRLPGEGRGEAEVSRREGRLAREEAGLPTQGPPSPGAPNTYQKATLALKTATPTS